MKAGFVNRAAAAEEQWQICKLGKSAHTELVNESIAVSSGYGRGYGAFLSERIKGICVKYSFVQRWGELHAKGNRLSWLLEPGRI